MSNFEDQDLPEDLREVEERLRANRPTFSDLELDQLKVRTMARISKGESRRRRGLRARIVGSPILASGLTILALGGTAAGAIVVGGITHHVSSAAVATYPPPPPTCGTTGKPPCPPPPVKGAHAVAKLKVKLSGIHRGCATALTARITGSGIAHVKTLVDKKRVPTKTIHKGSIYSAKTTLKPGGHKLSVTATFDKNHTPHTKTIRKSVRGCA